jgi:hypothetical protein
MRDVEAVLRQKQDDVGRVRQEIEALRTVIPLLTDDHPSGGDLVQELAFASSEIAANASDHDLAELELYYPFVRNMRLGERK